VGGAQLAGRLCHGCKRLLVRLVGAALQRTDLWWARVASGGRQESAPGGQQHAEQAQRALLLKLGPHPHEKRTCFSHASCALRC
jgi:hypothetical protein